MTRFYTFAGGGLTVSCQRGEEPPTVTDGYGGWNVLDRPRRKGYTQWDGVAPYRMKIPCLFDGWLNEVSIEDDLKTLGEMASPAASGEPPVIDVLGATPLPNVGRWVIESLDWGSNVIWSEASDNHPPYRRRQDVVVNLLQYVHPVSLPRKTPGATGRPHPKKPTWKVKRGDTLRSISAHIYGNQKYWRDIQKLNKIKDPKKLKLGSTLRMPK